MNYAGLNVLSVHNELGSSPIIIVIGLCLLFASVGYIEYNSSVNNRTRLIAAKIVGIVGVVTISVGLLWIYPTGHTIIRATIDSDAKFSEISRQYEIMGTHDGVYELREKNKHDTNRYVCEQCGNEIESGPPWVCLPCRSVLDTSK